MIGAVKEQTMTGRMIHRNAAKRLARVWQVGALVVAVAAGALWALDLPGGAQVSATEPPELTPLDEPASPHAAGAPSAKEDDIASMVERLELARAPINKPAETTSTPTEPLSTAGASWRYLGAIMEPNRKLALVSIDGMQRMIPEGRTLNTGGRDVTLEIVAPNAIIVLDNGQRMQIRKEGRSGPSVAWVSPTAGGGAVVAGMNGAVSTEGGDAGMIEMRARGVEAGEAQRLREQARRMANRNRAGAANAGVPPAPGMGTTGFSGMNAKSAGMETPATQADNTGDATQEDGRGPSQ
jgi:hypothetical protein